MAQQRDEYRLEPDQPLSDVPRFVKRPSLPVQDREETGAEKLMEWVWPISAWLIVIANMCIAFVAIRDMGTTTYSPWTHYFMSFAFCGTIGLLAVIHKFVLMRDRHGPNG